jgi:hypothetical protein
MISNSQKNIFIDIINKKNINNDLPLLTISFLDWFDSYDFSKFNLIEFGSGKSTNYFAKRVEKVTSFENNKEWFQNLKLNILNNVEYIFLEKNNEFNFTMNEKTILFIDYSGNRYQISKNILKQYQPNIVILDNSENYPNTSKYIASSGYMEIPFWGFRFYEDYQCSTSVFLKDIKVLPEKKYDFKPVGTLELDFINSWDQDFDN